MTLRQHEQSRWTDERTERLIQLWSDGYSASQIAAEMGGVTRSAVFGRIHRLGMSRPMAGISEEAKERRAQRQKEHEARRKAKRFAQTGVILKPKPKPEPAPTIDDLAIPFEQRKSLLELNEHTCRWPIGDPQSPEFFFCGGQPVEGHAYCRSHCAIAYQPPSDRQQSSLKWAFRRAA